MIQVNVKTDFAKLKTHLTEMARAQVPYASALALTRLAKKSQEKVKGTLKDYFIIRNNYVSNGIRIKRAEKRDWPDCFSVIGSRNDFMQLHEDSGDKTPKKMSYLAVPVMARQDKMTTLQSIWPSKLLKQKKGGFVYFQQTITKTGDQGIFRRKKIEKVTERAPRGSELARIRRLEGRSIDLMYVLKPLVHIKKKWDLRGIVGEVVRTGYDKEFGAALGGAMTTRRREE